MQVSVRGKHLKENRALEDYALEKASKLGRLAKDMTKVEIELLAEVSHLAKQDDFIVDITTHVTGHTFQVRDSEMDMYQAIDKAVRRMEEVLRRHKEKLIEKPRRLAARTKHQIEGSL